MISAPSTSTTLMSSSNCSNPFPSRISISTPFITNLTSSTRYNSPSTSMWSTTNLFSNPLSFSYFCMASSTNSFSPFSPTANRAQASSQNLFRNRISFGNSSDRSSLFGSSSLPGSINFPFSTSNSHNLSCVTNRIGSGISPMIQSSGHDQFFRGQSTSNCIHSQGNLCFGGSSNGNSFSSTFRNSTYDARVFRRVASDSRAVANLSHLDTTSPLDASRSTLSQCNVSNLPNDCRKSLNQSLNNSCSSGFDLATGSLHGIRSSLPGTRNLFHEIHYENCSQSYFSQFLS